MRKLTITWCSNYNGISFDIENGSIDDIKLTDDLTEESELPTITLDMVGNDNMDAVNEGKMESEDIEDFIDSDVILELAKLEIAEKTTEQFTLSFEYNSTDT